MFIELPFEPDAVRGEMIARYVKSDCVATKAVCEELLKKDTATFWYVSYDVSGQTIPLALIENLKVTWRNPGLSDAKNCILSFRLMSLARVMGA